MNERGQYGHPCYHDDGDQQRPSTSPTALSLLKRNLPFTLAAVAVMGVGVVAIMRHGTR